MKWTTEQEAVIAHRGGNLLVSAAAGSGKTAVLIEHIVSQITDTVRPLSVSELLVVTFTRAAAAEMRTRLQREISLRLEEDPDNHHLQRQIPLLSQAHISTIDSFCSWMVRNYFHLLNIDPDVRMMEEGESKLLQEDVISQVLEEAFEESAEDFVHFADAFGSERGDEPLRNMIQHLADAADSQPWPEEWLMSLRENTWDWKQALFELLQGRLRGLLSRSRQGKEQADAAEGLGKYADLFASDAAVISSVLAQEELAELLAAMDTASFDKAPRFSKKDVYDPAEKDRLLEWRKSVRADFKSLKDAYCVDLSAEDEREERCLRDIRVLVRLTLQFAEGYAREKERRNAADFSDMEHWALQLLLTKENGIDVPTPLAAELGDTFREIIVDEYQDSNLVQEMILKTLSGEDRGHPNMFMVGDVKQSIYKFRMAKPELFMGKYDRFVPALSAEGQDKHPASKITSTEDVPIDPAYQGRVAEGFSIDLGRNFRSRGRVLDAVNDLFARVMRRELGGVEYEERARLVHGMPFEGEDPTAELILLPKSDSTDAAESEALCAARRIRELMGPESDCLIRDADSGELRPPRYRDIVILLRAAAGWADIFVDVLNREGIPAYAQLKSGYFSAPEVQILLNFLRILDNPLQDIPLASVLLSPIGGWQEEELALMLAGSDPGALWDRLVSGSARGHFTEKWEAFAAMLETYRRLSPVLPIHELLERILSETDAGLVFSARAGGKIRRANIEMLMEMAMRYEETSYRGIFSFLRYIEQLQKYSLDLGEAQVLSEQEDLVRITTIHKSKGLEYPVVIVAGCGKQFNLTDTKEAMLIHDEKGLACDDIVPERAVRYRTLHKRMLAQVLTREMKGEELRVLYVAMTRAREKLILMGSAQDPDKLLEKWESAEAEESGFLPAWQIESANSYMDFLLMAHLSTPGGIFELRPEKAAEESEDAGVSRDLTVRRTLEKLLQQPPSDEELHRLLEEILAFRYPFEDVVHQKPAVSVSELKALALQRAMQEAPPEDGAEPMKKSAEEIERMAAGAARGTAYHRLMEKLPPAKGTDLQAVAACLQELGDRGEITPEGVAAVNPKDIVRYYCSPLGQKAIEAESRGMLRREQPFIMKVPLSDLRKDPDIPDTEWVLVQGIIDVCAETEDGWILWDYKTDRVPRRNGAEMLVERYREQLAQYRHALEAASGKPVLETWIYSFTLGEAIRL